MNLDINVIINLVCVIVSVCFFLAKLDALTKANKQFYETAIENLHNNISEKFAFLESNIAEKFYVVDERFNNITDHIKMLEKKQEESNKIKERLAIIEHTIKTAMDLRGTGHIFDSLNSTKSE